mmetsp:Transcript_4919/g.31473  ORF Transcript_4919/g.31473 Transcript_4919/m.31473 type:complete len:206 (+) Transcript_4919:442-1059(+)
MSWMRQVVRLPSKRWPDSLPAALGGRSMASGSWSERLKSMLGLSEPPPDAASRLESIDGNVYLQQMKVAAKMGGQAGFAKGQVAQATAKALNRQVEILEEMSTQERGCLGELEPSTKMRLVKEVGCTPHEVEDVVRKFIATRDVFAKVGQLRREGKPMPQSFEELSHLVGLEAPPATGQEKQTKISRNGPCPCKSGKKFKRCCGK